ncbi:MAG: flagellar hook-associated protein FlgK [Acidimicrobiales bacterium]
MDQGLSIAISGLNASMAQIDATTQNIANSQTPGYVTESATLAALPGGGTVDVGGGVQVTSIAQANDLLLSANNLQAQGALSNLGALQQVLTGIESVFPLGQNSSASSTQSANTSIAGQLSNFWSAWDAVAQDPSSLAPRTQIVDMAQGLATSLNEAATQLGQLATNTASQLGTNVGQVNNLLAQVASLNQSIVTAKSGGSGASALNDQLQNALGQLASLAGVSVGMQENGTAQVSIGGVTLVQGNTADTLAAVGSVGSGFVVSAYPTAADASSSTDGVKVAVSSGSIAGLLTGVNATIPQYQASLNTVASDLATTVNNQLAQGYSVVTAGTSPTYTSGAADPLFVGIGAAGISVNTSVVANPQLVAAIGSASGSPIGPNDASNAQAMAELGTVSTGPDLAYQNLVQGIGADTQNANSQVASQTAVASQAQQALQAVSGVNQNTQLTDLMQYQANYQASAKVVSVIDQTIQSLLAAV